MSNPTPPPPHQPRWHTLRTLRRWNTALAALDAPTPSRRRALCDLGVLALLGGVLVGLALWSAHWPVLTDHPRSFVVTLLAQLAVYGLAAGWVILRRPPARAALLLIVMVALATRVAFAAQTPTASHDIYRYVWDGRIQAQVVNPYRYAPSDPALVTYRDPAIYEHIDRKGVTTIYPPVAQGLFRAIYWLHPDSVTWTKLALIGFDLLTVLVLVGLLLRLGQRPERVLLYAWHPLLILELGHSGHLDVAAVCFLLLALWARLADRPVLAGVLLACATLTKFYAIVALPAFLWPGGLRAWRRDLQFGLAVIVAAILAYLPFLGVGSGVFGYLGGYVREEGIASGDRFYLLRQIERLVAAADFTPPRWLAMLHLTAAQGYQAFLIGALGALGLWCWLRPLPDERAIAGRALLLLLTLLTLTTPTYPWYALLVLAFVPFVGWRLLVPASVLLGTAGLLYLQWWWPGRPHLPVDLAYGGGTLALALVAAWATVRAIGPRLRWPIAPPPIRVLRVVAAGHGGATIAWPAPTATPASALLELGCGPGFYSRRFATRFAQLRVTGIDRSTEQLRHAWARAQAGGVANCRFVQGDVRARAQPTGTADAVLASRLFTILPERQQALAEMHRVLGPDGRCFIAEPRSRLWTAIPLHALWLLANLSRLIGRAPATYREPARATVLETSEFVDLLDSQPWAEVRQWHDRYYHYAVCRKATRTPEILAAD